MRSGAPDRRLMRLVHQRVIQVQLVDVTLAGTEAVYVEKHDLIDRGGERRVQLVLLDGLPADCVGADLVDQLRSCESGEVSRRQMGRKSEPQKRLQVFSSPNRHDAVNDVRHFGDLGGASDFAARIAIRERAIRGLLRPYCDAANGHIPLGQRYRGAKTHRDRGVLRLADPQAQRDPAQPEIGHRRIDLDAQRRAVLGKDESLLHRRAAIGADLQGQEGLAIGVCRKVDLDRIGRIASRRNEQHRVAGTA
jgi:hypothetical protein